MTSELKLVVTMQLKYRNQNLGPLREKHNSVNYQWNQEDVSLIYIHASKSTYRRQGVFVAAGKEYHTPKYSLNLEEPSKFL
jgi:hypothetical protein